MIAQLFFEPGDKAWHLFSEPWELEGDTRMHLDPGDKAMLIPVPVLPWKDPDKVKMILSAHDDPWEAIREIENFPVMARQQRRESLQSLTQAERELVRLMAGEGLAYADIANRLSKSRQTVANQASNVYRKLSAFLSQTKGEEVKVNRAYLIHWLAPYIGREGEE